ncbi:MAG: DMT family transporter [Metallibacterium scheffleri]|uniref:EamA family transporter n=1 Tax=Metallibacterium scheffleri TaxID=993689 RepID=A0A4S3KRX9_9GAMM|nr:DMT family transporter [Metallibacterium scheffleri]THD11809.1 EamA family transporter [Metallibacterium scheffleri]
MSTRGARGALLALAALTLIWSYNWIVMKQALAYSGPFTFSALRYVGGTAVLFVLLLARRESLAPPPFWPTLGIGMAQTAGFQALVQWALVSGGAGKTALLAYTMPFWAIALAWPLLGSRPGGRQWWSIAVAACGLLLVIAPWQGVGSTRSVLLALAGGLSWAVGTVLAKRLFVRHPDVALLSVSAWQMLYGTLLLVLLALLIPQPVVQWTPPFIAAVAYNVLLASGLGWALWLLVVQRLPAQVASLTSLAIPLMGVLLAWLILHEQPGIWEVAGMALIAMALLSLRRTSMR